MSPWTPRDSLLAGIREIQYEGTVTAHQAFVQLAGPDEAATKSFEFLSRLL